MLVEGSGDGTEGSKHGTLFVAIGTGMETDEGDLLGCQALLHLIVEVAELASRDTGKALGLGSSKLLLTDAAVGLLAHGLEPAGIHEGPDVNSNLLDALGIERGRVMVGNILNTAGSIADLGGGALGVVDEVGISLGEGLVELVTDGAEVVLGELGELGEDTETGRVKGVHGTEKLGLGQLVEGVHADEASADLGVLEDTGPDAALLLVVDVVLGEITPGRAVLVVEELLEVIGADELEHVLWEILDVISQLFDINVKLLEGTATHVLANDLVVLVGVVLKFRFLSDDHGHDVLHDLGKVLLATEELKTLDTSAFLLALVISVGDQVNVSQAHLREEIIRKLFDLGKDHALHWSFHVEEGLGGDLQARLDTFRHKVGGLVRLSEALDETDISLAPGTLAAPVVQEGNGKRGEEVGVGLVELASLDLVYVLGAQFMSGRVVEDPVLGTAR